LIKSLSIQRFLKVLHPRREKSELQVSTLSYSPPFHWITTKKVLRQLLRFTDPTHEKMQLRVFEEGLLEEDVYVILLVDSYEETNGREVPLQEDFNFLDDLNSLGTIDLGETLLVLGRNEFSRDLVTLLNNPCTKLRLMESVKGIPK
jgi:hypothetical protein